MSLAQVMSKEVKIIGASGYTHDDILKVINHINDKKAKGIKMLTEADESSVGPASFTIEDPDGNPILVDQHV